VPAIEVQHLSKRFGGFLAVDDVSFTVEAGEVVGFLGPNGAGKTTTMRILTGYLPPSEGVVRIHGHDSFRESLAARGAVGYLPETPPLHPEMTVASYVRYVTAIKGVPRDRRRNAVACALGRCGLSDVANRVISTLSKGYRQRVGLAQAIVHEPPVLVLDEPTVGLDPIQIREIRSLIAQLSAPKSRGERQTVILSTHILTEVEAICDRVILMDRGAVALDESLASLTSGGRRLEDVFTQVTSSDRPADPVPGRAGPEPGSGNGPGSATDAGARPSSEARS
jgi:ABC-2 type transport system ATP-binding protein